MLGKKKRDVMSAAHIKKNTQGTSNEISFSVLDAIKNEADGEKSESKRGSWLGVIPLFTLPGRKKTVATPKKEQGLHLPGGEFVSTETDTRTPIAVLPKASDDSGASSVASPVAEPAPTFTSPAPAPEKIIDPAAEVTRRKKRRRRAKILAATATSVVVLALLAAGGMWLYKEYNEHRSLQSRLMNSIDTIEQADETVLVLDEFVVSILNDDFGELTSENVTSRADELLATLPTASSQLDAAKRDAQVAADGLGESTDREAAYQALICIDARREMLTEGEKILEEAKRAVTVAETMSAGWDLLLQADTAARDSAELISDMTEENVRASIEKSNEAISLLNQAVALFSQAQKTNSSAVSDDYLTYTDLRIQAMHCAIASNEAYLNREKDEMVAQNDSYNRLDSQAATLAQSFPSDPTDGAKAALRAAMGGENGAYLSARSRAGAADGFLRDYLGTQGK